ncbi:sulfotransferase domain-containing protein [Candidatus Pelagibacter sp.]|nr:sulfotransferase domain-containing protein [Candidatus Pelagibacter sp.]
MIIWLSSYPKSGNTLVRSLLSAYLFTDDGKFNFESLKNISLFPDITFFEKLGVNVESDDEVLKNYIRAQEEINKNNYKAVTFLKTHSTLHSINNHKFTNYKNTHGVIYIVRDPRNVVTSYANHNQITIEQAAEAIKSFKVLGGVKNSKIAADRGKTHVGSWSSHYNVWKEFKKTNRYLLVKYEDLISDTKTQFLRMLNFIYTLGNAKHTIDQEKLNNAINTTTFENLQNMEKLMPFHEAKKINNKYVTFFKYGPKNDWKQILSSKISQNLELEFSTEMKELGYL